MNIKGYCIVIEGNQQSVEGFHALSDSIDEHETGISLYPFKATTPDTVVQDMALHGIKWTYPWDKEEVHEPTGLRLHPYKTSDRLARMSCFMSHWRLWLKAASDSIMIFEDDAIFTKHMPRSILGGDEWAIGINDPRGATRKAGVYHEVVQAQEEDVCEVPWVDDEAVPQGLAGASAYFMSCAAADVVLQAVEAYGAWPNDATLIKQLVPNLGQSRTYFTKVQGTRSTLA